VAVAYTVPKPVCQAQRLEHAKAAAADGEWPRALELYQDTSRHARDDYIQWLEATLGAAEAARELRKFALADALLLEVARVAPDKLPFDARRGRVKYELARGDGPRAIAELALLLDGRAAALEMALVEQVAVTLALTPHADAAVAMLAEQLALTPDDDALIHLTCRTVTLAEDATGAPTAIALPPLPCLATGEQP